MWILEEDAASISAFPSLAPDETRAHAGLGTNGSIKVLEPPAGAETHPELDQADHVTGQAARMKRWTLKASPASNDAEHLKAPAWREVAYAGGKEIPETGLGSRLAAAVPLLEAAGRSHVYGFLLMDEYLSDRSRADLESLGVVLLGPHGSVHKVKLPTDLHRISVVVDLAFVEWVGFPSTELKISPELQEIHDHPALSSSPSELPVVINLFESNDSSEFADGLLAAGAELGRYDPELISYRAVIEVEDIEAIATLDYVLYIELILPTTVGHDQSMATIGVDYIRAGFDGDTTVLGIMDTGFMLGGGAAVMHEDLNANGCGINFTTDSAGVWNDEHGHGTHVLATIMGRGVADSRNRGVATGIGSGNKVRAAKVWKSTNSGTSAWMESAMDFLDDATACNSPRPHVVNVSGGGAGTNHRGTDSLSRKLDTKVYEFDQLYVVSGGNTGPHAGTVSTPGVAKNALAVGNVWDSGLWRVGDINHYSSRGPTGDGRMKPNLVAPGTVITSASAGTTDQYRNWSGTSMATPHVTGLAATLMEHYPSHFEWRPYLLRAYLMTTSILHDDASTPTTNTAGGRNSYGLGRVTSYRSHWSDPSSNGFRSFWSVGTVDNDTWIQRDINVPAGTERLVVVTTWDEPAASAGAPNAVTWDLDLWSDSGADCTPDPIGQCGDMASQSRVDNVEYLIIENPSAATYRFKVIPWNAPASGVAAAIAISLISGDPRPNIDLDVTVSTLSPTVGTNFTVTTTVSNPAYIASGVYLARAQFTSGLLQQDVTTTRKDGVAMSFGPGRELTLGNIRASDSRSATWTFAASSTESKTLDFQTWAENTGVRSKTVFIDPVAPGPLEIQSHMVDDDTYGNSVGDGDGMAECGEIIELYIELSNAGAGTSLGTVANVSTTDPAATFMFNTSSVHGDIAAGGWATNDDDFDIELDPVMPLAHTLKLDVSITATNGGPWNRTLDLAVTCAEIFADGFESGNLTQWTMQWP